MAMSRCSWGGAFTSATISREATAAARMAMSNCVSVLGSVNKYPSVNMLAWIKERNDSLHRMRNRTKRNKQTPTYQIRARTKMYTDFRGILSKRPAVITLLHIAVVQKRTRFIIHTDWTHDGQAQILGCILLEQTKGNYGYVYKENKKTIGWHYQDMCDVQ